MSAYLESITATNFRSLRGTITVPLDAPVILLHGANGAGKTSLLSAIEMALTGEIAASRRADPSYKSHLVHRGLDAAGLKLAISGLGNANHSTSEITIRDGVLSGNPVLDSELARFYGERCYLAQSTLGRLLEIYQSAKPSGDSPLTRFVKDLLGLDYLDVLVEGLHSANDVRNFRKVIPEYSEVELSKETAERDVRTAKVELKELEVEFGIRKIELVRTLSDLFGEPDIPIDDFLSGSRNRLSDADIENRLIAVAGLRHVVLSLKSRLAQAATGGAADENQKLLEEENQRSAIGALDKWWNEQGKDLDSLLQLLQADFPELPSAASSDPMQAYEAGVERLRREIERSSTQLSENQSLQLELEAYAVAIEQNQARIAIADEQIASVAIDAQALSRALAEIIPHLHDENCPVCGRDFSEVSTVSLATHVSSSVGMLAEQAGRLHELTKARLSAVTALSNDERARDAALAKQLPAESKSLLEIRLNRYQEHRRRLEDMKLHAIEGVQLMRNATEARTRLSERRSQDQYASDAREEVSRICAEIGLPIPKESENVRELVETLDEKLKSDLEELTNKKTNLALAVEGFIRIEKHRATLEELKKSISVSEDAMLSATASLQRGDELRQVARTLSKAAAETRMTTVGSVFNSALNKIWRDLFVRLAPTEPFVPAFCLPKNVGDFISAQLETVHRDGGAAGAPGAMLSAGNLNTAALTLFLALHLSVKPQLPWLILDDPVQSMDEVHISQFAALLRTLSKDLGRQVIIAVHDRPLFEYLSLELSPAFSGDKLITVELSRSQDGVSLADPTFTHWTQDLAIAA